MWKRFPCIPIINKFLLVLLILSGIYSPVLSAQSIHDPTHGFSKSVSRGGTSSSSNMNLTEGDMLWNQTYDYARTKDLAFSVIETADKGLAIAARVFYIDGEIWDQDGLLIKTDAVGEVQWTQSYGGNRTEYARDVIQTADGGFAMAGSTSTNSTGRTDGWLVKTSSGGEEEWSQQYAGIDFDDFNALIQTREGGYALAGQRNFNAWIVKTDPRGKKEWAHTLGRGGFGRAQDIIQTMDRGYCVVGSCGNLLNYDLWVIKLAKNGTVEWNRTYNSIRGKTPDDHGYSVIQTADRDFVLFGDTVNLHNETGTDFWLVKTDAAGVPLWNRTYGEEGTESLYAGIKTIDGGFALTGYTNSFGVERSDFYLVKTDAQGVLEWNRTYGTSYWEEARSLVQTSDSGFVLVGMLRPPIAGSTPNTNIWFVKVKGRGVPPSSTPSFWILFFFPTTLVLGCLVLFFSSKRKRRINE
ncbi:hypothetical protein CEE45_06925 [Candidatus Heimdallarchaeota archaeon B3_Heim]|nr:MAG: hypothetical protein CEE45_06925 [Candidatus Heimdallarchaeota archaeon B3_Heim]